ncbi:MAG TPA: hypothetical protein VLM11_06740 [Streptosporangiaceae bacterium]|nr:hypothetical protein [Streptosporangiaceae bacterium]
MRPAGDDNALAEGLAEVAASQVSVGGRYPLSTEQRPVISVSRWAQGDKRLPRRPQH